MKTAFAIVALSVLACNTQTAGSAGSTGPIQQAQAAIRALEDRDAATVEACEADVRTCFESNADGGASGACEALRDQCREAKEALEDVRRPAVDCWHEVEDCAEHQKPFPHGDATASDAGAGCGVKPRDCGQMGDDADQDRNPILECKSEVKECLSSIRHRQNDWREECGDVRDACSNICGLAARSGREHGSSNRAGGARDRIRQLLEGLRQRHGGHGRGDHGSPDDRSDAGP
jgi:hypothetical protein